MTTKTVVAAWVATMTLRTWFVERLESVRADESGSPTLETVVIAAGLLALAVGLVLVIKAAVTNYSSQIN